MNREKIKVKIKIYPDGYNFIVDSRGIRYEPRNNNWFYAYGFIDSYISNANSIFAIVIHKYTIKQYCIEQLEIASDEEFNKNF